MCTYLPRSRLLLQTHPLSFILFAHQISVLTTLNFRPPLTLEQYQYMQPFYHNIYQILPRINLPPQTNTNQQLIPLDNNHTP